MSPTPIILAALASSCRVLSTHSQLLSAERREVFELHLQWMEVVHSQGTSDESKEAKSRDIAVRMARFILNHEPSRNKSWQ
jgi:hypothetical protein